MNSDIISKSILDEIEDVVYISNPKTHELYYINGMLKRTLGNPTDEQWRRQKCYKILQGLDEPCPFCTNHLLKSDGFYNWEHHNKLLNLHYLIQDKLVTFEGIEARLEIAKDITQRKLLEQDLRHRLEQAEVLNSCISLLHTTDSPHQSINKLLGLVAGYHNAERGYIFLLSPDGTLVSNSHEWCAPGVEPQIKELQNIDASIVSHWFEKYREVGEFYIDSITQELDPESEEYKILDMQGIASLVTAPLYNTDGSFMGFIGVDNPSENTHETAIICAISSFVSDFLDKNAQMEKLYQVSYFDSLTGLRNRHSYSLRIQSLMDTVPKTLGVIYTDINGLKAINDKLGHKEGDVYIKRLGDVLKSLCTLCTFRIGGDEFVLLCADVSREDFEEKLAGIRAFINKDELPYSAMGYCWREGNCNVIEQIEEADHLMYENKERQYAQFGGKSDLFRRKYLLDAANRVPIYSEGEVR